ncbi:MAG: GAF domain-containing protein [Chitinivibrionales bacterium]|nr:GAF domain-containing protein [Chitinivibrionales bacterium]MBD3396385.1 GAF domain-containing protein [Chitinivibrionales bacterium]
MPACPCVRSGRHDRSVPAMTHQNSITLTDALIEVFQAINTGADLVSILGTTKDVAMRLIDAERGSIFLRDRAGRSVWTLLADGVQMIRVPEGRGIVGEVIRNNATMTVADASKDARFYGDIDKQTGYVTKSILCAPMCNRHGEAFGAIELLNKQSGPFTEEDERTLGIFGTQAGLAIEHVEMYEDLEQNLHQFQLLAAIQDNINAAMEVDQICREILSKLLPLVGGLAGVIHITIGAKPIYCGYSAGDGLVVWESDEARECPGFIKDLIDAVESVPPERRDGHVINLPDLVCVEMVREDRGIGYLAARLARDESRLFNARPLDYLKIIAAQTVTLLDKKEAMDERKRSEKQALLGSMLSMVVHDMKNPLCGASGFAQLIRQKTGDEGIRKYSNKILDVLERLERMNSELLMYVRGDSVQLERSEVRLRELLEQLVESMAESFALGGISVSVRCESGEDIEIQADRDRLVRVFTNILSNAREAIDGSGAINIVVGGDNGNARIRFSDTGKGMPAHVARRVFEPFVTHGKKTGTGLGMAIARTIVERHGGSITVDSTLGKGTIFTINLPIP